METQAKSRTVRPDAEAIKRLRLGKGWRVEDLARQAKCSVKTVENVERGSNVYLFTLGKFAKALGVDYRSLLPDTGPAPEPPQRRFEVQIKLSIPFEDFDESEQLVGFIELLKRVLSARDEIGVKAVTDGSVVITLELGEEDVASLIGAYNNAALDELNVSTFHIVVPQGESPPDVPVASEQQRASARFRKKQKMLKELKAQLESDAQKTPRDDPGERP
ncbi:MAG: helix-turn-helix transcriptional regulator [Isosphaeraceae bacterium]|nr:helix-turn-helix transcriptional regulator [Isosphaeraceae bacterium]